MAAGRSEASLARVNGGERSLLAATLGLSLADPFQAIFLAVFLLSTPAVAFVVFALGEGRDEPADSREFWAIVNSYGFSVAYCLLYAYPLISPLQQHRRAGGFRDRLHVAQGNWVVWLSCFTQIAFQIAHNLFVPQLHAIRGTLLEWPFYSYGLSDDRWSNYQNGTSLVPQVWLINVNDAGLGVLVFFLLVAQWRSPKSRGVWVATVLMIVFRDATLFRETVEYMWDHHRLGYPHTTADPALRPHAIACLWFVNIFWLIAPVLSAVWAYYVLTDRYSSTTTATKKLR